MSILCIGMGLSACKKCYTCTSTYSGGGFPQVAGSEYCSKTNTQAQLNEEDSLCIQSGGTWEKGNGSGGI